MITQAFKRWLQKLFGWFSGKPPVEAEYAHVVSTVNKSVTQEPASRNSSDVGLSQPNPGTVQRVLGQGETSCSTIEEWPERGIPPAPTPNTNTNEKNEAPPSLPAVPSPSTTLPTTPATPSIESIVTAPEKPATINEHTFPDAPPPTPTPEQQLEFLHYLVRRGIVNEGFAAGQTPEQYKKH